MWPTKKEGKSVSKGQPNHPGQVFGYPGDGVKLYDPRWKAGFMITVKQIDERWMVVNRVIANGIFEGRSDGIEVSMADMGMVPYSNGSWNQYNWVTLGIDNG